LELNFVKDSFDQVTMKQKFSSSKTEVMMDRIKKEIVCVLTRCSQSIALTVLDYKTVLNKLTDSLLQIAPFGQMESTQKELNVYSIIEL
jgi:hypothetical protein